MKKTCRYLSACTLILSAGLFLAGCNSSDDDNAPFDDSGSSISPPSVPTDLRGVVYSSTAIELEWNAATDDGTVVEYQIYRDDSLVATQSTLRFYENALPPSTTQTYRVLAVDNEGNVSDVAVIDMTTLDDGPAISEANFSVILPYAVSIANGDLFDDLREMVDSTDASWLTAADFDDITGLTLIDQGDDPTSDLYYFYEYECEFGGSYVFYKDNWIQFGGAFKGNYDACQIESNIQSGDFSRVASADKAAPYNQKLDSNYNLTVQNDVLGNQRNLTGNLVVNDSQVENRFNFTEASYFEHNLMWSTIISDIFINVYATDEDQLLHYEIPFSRTFDASFRVQGPQTGDEFLTVAIQFETSDETELNYQTGSLTVTAEDGSSMVMAADNSDPDTFQLSFSQADSSTALTVPWSDDYRLKCFQAPAFDARFAACE